MTGNKPEQIFRIGALSAAIFLNDREPRADSRRENRSITFQRRYFDRKTNE